MDGRDEAAVLIEVWRGPFLESAHRGHAVICDARGHVLAAWGNPETRILPRSSCKMIQALPLTECGAGAGLSPERLALACASHSGARLHLDLVAAWLHDLGLSEADLRCGPQMPLDRSERDRLRAEAAPPRALHHNCSGKHAGFLALARHVGGGPDYVDPDHPVQIAIRAAFEEMTGETSPGFGIDGCAAPNFATSLHGLARAMARMADPRGLGPVRETAARRLVEAMRTHPRLIAGEGRICTDLIEASGRRIVAKTGAEGVFTAILPDRGLGVAVKIADGATRGADCAITALLARLGATPPEDPAISRRIHPEIRTSAGAPAGRISPAPAFWEAGAAL